LIAESRNGTYTAIQCKFKGLNESPTRRDIATFLDLSRNHCKNIKEQILVHTGTNGIKKSGLLPDSFTQVGLDFWTSLTEEDWKAINKTIKAKKYVLKKRTPKNHQSEAIKASYDYFIKKGKRRGKLIMPCGTGKSLTAYWINQSLKSNSTIVAVPSLALIKQSLDDWTKEMLVTRKNNQPDWICICSDESTGKLNDDYVIDKFSLGIPTTTDPKEISNFLKLKSANGKIIFAKYDLAILDEAHKTVGDAEKSFATLLKEESINIKIRLFMTATEKRIKGAKDDILSMDDLSVYGETFYKLSFKNAIDQKIITDYRIITTIINNNEIKNALETNRYISDKSEKIQNAEIQMLTSALAVKKSISAYNLNHIVSFHKSIEAAKEFQKLYKKIDFYKQGTEVFHISSKQNAGNRSKLLNDFKNCKKALITNARCLTEGVDVPAIDCVLFADEKNSVIDIVQAAGRALRKFKDLNTGKEKKLGYIIIPILLNQNETYEDLINSNKFKTVLRIISSLATQDETIAEELKLINENGRKGGNGKIQFNIKLDKSLKVNIKELSKKIQTRVWERVAKINFRSYNESVAFTSQLGLKNVNEWALYSASGKKPFDIPAKPYITYFKEWSGWNNWLGTKNKNNWEISKNSFSYDEAKSFLKNECKGTINSIGLFNKWKINKLESVPPFPNKMPRAPISTYVRAGEWVSSYDFFGKKEEKKAKTSKRYDFIMPKISYKDLKNIIRKQNLNSRDEYIKWLKRVGVTKVKKGYYAPVFPDRSYKIEFEGWKNWHDWLGVS